MQGKWREQDKIHACGESMKKHGELNDPFCYQLGFFDAYTHLKAENEKLQREANQAIFEREKSASDHVKKYEALQTQNAKLKAALEKITKSDGKAGVEDSELFEQYFTHVEPKPMGTPKQIFRMGHAQGMSHCAKIARTTLAEIGGDDA